MLKSLWWYTKSVSGLRYGYDVSGRPPISCEDLVGDCFETKSLFLLCTKL